MLIKFRKYFWCEGRFTAFSLLQVQLCLPTLPIALEFLLFLFIGFIVRSITITKTPFEMYFCKTHLKIMYLKDNQEETRSVWGGKRSVYS